MPRKTREVQERGNTAGYTSLNVHFKSARYILHEWEKKNKKKQRKAKKKNKKGYETECSYMDDKASNSLYSDDATRSRISPPFVFPLKKCTVMIIP